MTGRRFTVATVLACLIWLAAGTYTATFMYRGWIPHDEGTIGQTAERVLAGEVPHRDFDDTYTGGLAYLNAAAMRIFGVNLRAPRLVVFAFFMGFLAAVYGIARRIASPMAGLLAIVLATVWSLPNYFVSLPSWYNLFLATFGVLAFMRYLDNGRRRWLVVAGSCGGLSILFKITGVYYLAGGVLFLAYLEQDRAAAANDSPGSRSGFRPVAAIPSVVLVLLCVALSRSAPLELLFLFLPPLALCVFVAWREWAVGRGAPSARIAGLARLVAPFAAGAAIPIGLFVVFYWQQHGLAELVRGVFVLPQRRLAEANLTPPPIATVGLTVPYVALLLAGRDRAVPREGVIAAGLMLLFVMAILFGRHDSVYQGIWAVARAMPLAATAAGIAVIGRFSRAARDPGGRLAADRLFLVVTMAAMVALVQFPYATPIYFTYAAPMTMLALLGIVFATPLAPRRIHLTVAALLFLFAAVFVNRSYAWNLGLRHIPFAPSARLDGDRGGGLRVSDADARTYGEVVALAREHAGGGTIYAGPDCPEVYFLSEFPNPTRAIFDFLSPEPLDAAAMTDLLARAPIRAAVVNTTPEFSPRLDAGVLAVLERQFPTAVQVGKFVVRY